MNIFILFLVTLLMAGYYLIGSPSVRIDRHETEYAVAAADMRAIAECAATAHNAMMRGDKFIDVCVEQNGIYGDTVCLNSRMAVTACEIVRNKKPDFSYAITATAPLEPDQYNGMLEILEQNYPDVGTFGIYQNGVILSGGSTVPRSVPKNLAGKMELTDGQLVYMTQYEMRDSETEFANPDAGDVNCAVGTVKTYRFGRWQCIGINPKTTCVGDMIWDTELLECVPDEARRPLCADRQTAVIVDSVWECINPFSDKTCPDKMTPRLNYNTLEWECVTDPTLTTADTKCSSVRYAAVCGPLGATLRIPTTSCTDCESAVTDTDTCTTYCIPNPEKINDTKCYPGGAASCSGPSKGFYFGFPTQTYAARVSDLNGHTIQLDRAHSQNRRFNCMDCGDRGIDDTRSYPPYIIICNE